eukprot:13825323-Ditylum_brightwellii.AAC.1
MLLHERAMRQISKYLSVTLDKGMIYDPDSSLGIQCFVNTDFTVSWGKANDDSPENVMSHTAEVGYIVPSLAMCKVIPFMDLLEELSTVFDLHVPKPEIDCK